MFWAFLIGLVIGCVFGFCLGRSIILESTAKPVEVTIERPSPTPKVVNEDWPIKDDEEMRLLKEGMKHSLHMYKYCASTGSTTAQSFKNDYISQARQYNRLAAKQNAQGIEVKELAEWPGTL